MPGCVGGIRRGQAAPHPLSPDQPSPVPPRPGWPPSCRPLVPREAPRAPRLPQPLEQWGRGPGGAGPAPSLQSGPWPGAWLAGQECPSLARKMLTLCRLVEAPSSAGWNRAQLMGPGLWGETEAGVGVGGLGRCKERIQEGKPDQTDQRSETRRRSTRWFPRPFPSTSCAPHYKVCGHRAQPDTHKEPWRGHGGLRFVEGERCRGALYDSPLGGMS